MRYLLKILFNNIMSHKLPKRSLNIELNLIMIFYKLDV